MGDIADDIVDGLACEECTMPIGSACGYPRKCSACKNPDKPKRAAKPKPKKEDNQLGLI
jgi:hypothetical protein